MLTPKQIDEIREHLEKAQNPLFFFDNDNDGLCSFLLLQRYLGRGRGVAIKSFPELSAAYYRKVKELNPDYIFILDKPLVSDEFFEKIRADNIPVVWIDHHQVDRCSCGNLSHPPDPKGCKFNWINYYNPFLNDKTSEPVAYLSYKIANKKDDIWLGVIGCVSDAMLPDFYNEFLKIYPELAKKNPKSAFDVFYDSEIGRIAQILDFSLKDTTTNVVNMLRFMMRAKGPLDILEENFKTKQILKRYGEINSKFEGLIEKAKEEVGDKMIYFTYGGQYSLSAHVSNKLSYEFPGKVIVVVYLSGDFANVSLRGKNIRPLTLKAIEEIDSASGGGHEDATGAKMLVSDLPKFKENIFRLVNGE